MRNFLTSLLLFISSSAILVAQDDGGDAPARPTPAELAASSNLIVLAQLRFVEYDTPRESPVEGTARFEVLLPYKVPEPINRLTVYEQGVKEIECYFPDEPAAEEQRRYLLFLVPDPEEDTRYRGNPRGCALEILTTTDGRYAVRWPQPAVRLDATPEDLVRPMDFTGPGARVYAGNMTSTSIERRIAEDNMAREGDYLVYNRGIYLGDFRKLLGEAGVTPDRIQREGMD